MTVTTNQKLDQVISLMERLANLPTTPATPVTPSADHDLLLKVDTRLEVLQQSVDKLTILNGSFITREEHNEVLKTNADHETRLRFLEKGLTVVITWGSALVVGMGILEFIVNHLWK